MQIQFDSEDLKPLIEHIVREVVAQLGNGATNAHRDDETPRLWTQDETAEFLGVSSRTVWNLADRGELPCVRVGNSVRYDPADVRAYIEKQKGTGHGQHQPQTERATSDSVQGA